jgi:cytochrome c551/c552
MVRNACMDCHSNETVWPWYSNIAPSSWLLQADVEEGRARFNMSNWPTNAAGQQGLVEEMVRVIQRGSMPPFQYLIIHSNASFSAALKEQLIQGLQNSVK